MEGEPAPLPPGVDVSAYRIVQEALTNALKHAGPARAHVYLRYGDEDLELEILDDGAGSANGGGSGHGLAGHPRAGRRHRRRDGLGPRVRRAATPCAPGCRSGRRDDQGPARRRPEPGARGLPDDPQGRGRHRRRRRSGGRPRGGCEVRDASARRRADGRAHAGDERHRGDAGDRDGGGRAAGRRADDVRPRRVRLRGAAIGGERAFCSRTRRSTSCCRRSGSPPTAARCSPRRSRGG